MIGKLCDCLWGTSIRRQLVFSVAFVYLVLMTGFAGYFVVSQREFLRDKARSHATARTELLAASCLHGVLANEVSGLQEIITSLLQDRGVRYAMILDPQGRVLAHTDPSRDGLYLTDDASQRLLRGAPAPQILFQSEDMLDIAVPIVLQGRTLGWARLARDLTADNIHLRRMTRTSAVFTLIAIVIGTLVAAAVGRSALKPLRSLLEATGRVTRNQLDYRAPVTTRNEVGAVTAAFNNALDRLCGQIAERQKAEELLREQARQIMESANILAAAAGDIVTAATQVAATATESASAVAQTSTTVAEVRQTVQTSSEKAKAVAAAARQTAEVSQAGKKSTEDSVQGMRHIRQQMDSIADSMVRLSEQTQAISQIISTVDDIAAQSNLLAVNAAIEAAKAGDQGRGFAVVAQEVRNLAEQSKLATSRVREILHDIQKATGAAVMATEQGSKAVESGVRQSAQAGESIVALAGSVNESAQAATQIAASNQQQLIGMEQVASAMENIKQSSAQSAASARHLEESARDLNALGQKLRDLTSLYNVEDHRS